MTAASERVVASSAHRSAISDAVRLPRGPELSWDLIRANIHWLGNYRDMTIQRYGCPPDGLIEALAVLAEAYAAGSDSRPRETEPTAPPKILVLGQDAVIDLEEAAQMLELKPDSVRDLCRRGVLAAHKRRNRWFPVNAAVLERVAMSEEA